MFIFCKTNLLGNLSTNAILVNMRTTLYPKKSPVNMKFKYLNGLPGVQEASNTGVHSPGVPGLPDQQQLVIGLITHTDHSHWCCDGISHVTTVTTPAPGSGH